MNDPQELQKVLAELERIQSRFNKAGYKMVSLSDGKNSQMSPADALVERATLLNLTVPEITEGVSLLK